MVSERGSEQCLEKSASTLISTSFGPIKRMAKRTRPLLLNAAGKIIIHMRQKSTACPALYIRQTSPYLVGPRSGSKPKPRCGFTLVKPSIKRRGFNVYIFDYCTIALWPGLGKAHTKANPVCKAPPTITEQPRPTRRGFLLPGDRNFKKYYCIVRAFMRQPS